MNGLVRDRGVKRMGITEVEVRKRLMEVTRGTVLIRGAWMQSKKDVKDMHLLLRELWMIDDDKVLDKLEKKGVNVQNRRKTQARRYDTLLVKKKQMEQRLYDLEKVSPSELGMKSSWKSWTNYQNRINKEIKEVKDELVATKSMLNLK